MRQIATDRDNPGACRHFVSLVLSALCGKFRVASRFDTRVDGHAFCTRGHPSIRCGREVALLMENHVVWLTKREVAEIARVHVRTVERAIASGKLRASKPNGSVRIRRSWMNAWLASALVLVLLCLACLVACVTSDAWADLMMRARCPRMQFVD